MHVPEGEFAPSILCNTDREGRKDFDSVQEPMHELDYRLMLGKTLLADRLCT